MLAAICVSIIVFCSVLLCSICVYVAHEYFTTSKIAYAIMCVVCGFVVASSLGFVSDWFLGMV